MKYWIYQDNQVKGPYDRAQIQKLSGFESESLVCPEGRKGTDMGDWQRASSVPELSLLLPSERAATATIGSEDSFIRESVEDLKRKVSEFEERLEHMQKSLDERPEPAPAQASAPASEESNKEIAAKLEEIDDKLVALSSLDGDLRKLRSRVEELEQRPVAIPPPAPEPVIEKPAAASTPVPAPVLAPAPALELPIVQAPAAKPAAFEAIDFKIETFEKTSLGESSKLAIEPLAVTAPAPNPEPLVLAPPPMPASSPFAAFPPAPEPERLPALTPVPVSMPTPLPAESVNPFSAPPPFPGSAPTPLSEFVVPQQPTPFPSMVPDSSVFGLPPAQMSKPPMDAVEMVPGAAAGSGKGGGKKAVIFLAVIVFVVGGALLGSFYHDFARSNKRAAQASMDTSRSETPVPAPIPPAKEANAPLPSDQPMPEMPAVDYSQLAVDLVKAFVPNGGEASVGQQLEKAFPSKGGLSPWMVEPLLGQNKYQVTFYVGTRPVYVFLVEPNQKLVNGVNDAAKGLLNGQAPQTNIAPRPAKKPRRVAKRKPAPTPHDMMIVAPQQKAAPSQDSGIDDLLKDDSAPAKKGQ